MFLEDGDSRSALTYVLTGVLNVSIDGLSWCFAIREKDVGILHSTPALAFIPFTLLAHTLTF